MIVISDDPSSLATEDGVSGESGTLNEETKEISVHVVTITAAGEICTHLEHVEGTTGVHTG